MKANFPLFALAAGLLLLLASPALAGSSSASAVFGSYMDEFINYWREKLRQQNSIVMGVFLLGGVALLIIRSAGRKIK
ncbi:MAG: hypothetical protein K8U57_31515 [Planctomycetes bacterium]|nr:hypothetical protein [Planctomycetota bacterium]